MEKINCFVSYSHKDAKLCERFLAIAKNLKRFYKINMWFDGVIPAGGNIDDNVKQNLLIADIVFALLSPDYISSYYCYEKELHLAIERHEKGECIVIPVMLKPLMSDDFIFNKLKIVPKDGKPITKFKPYDNGFNDAFASILDVLKNFKKALIPNPPDPPTPFKKQRPTNDKIKYQIVKNGKFAQLQLKQILFDEQIIYQQNLYDFIIDMDKLTHDSLNKFQQEFISTPKKQKRAINNWHKEILHKYLFQVAGYIQKYFVGLTNTCVHFRYKKGNEYKQFVNIGYEEKPQIPLVPLPAHEGIINVSSSLKYPVIKKYNNELHDKVHAEENIQRDYITCTFNNVANNFSVNFSMCITIKGSMPKRNKHLFEIMSINRFDILIDKYINQFIVSLKDIDNRMNLAKIF